MLQLRLQRWAVAFRTWRTSVMCFKAGWPGCDPANIKDCCVGLTFHTQLNAGFVTAMVTFTGVRLLSANVLTYCLMLL